MTDEFTRLPDDVAKTTVGEDRLRNVHRSAETDAASEFIGEELVISYPSTDEPVIDEESIRVTPGEVTALVGPNGSGKSTLLKGLADQLALDDGAVLLDGTDIRSLSTKELARQLGLLSQENVSPDSITVEKLVEHGWQFAVSRTKQCGPIRSQIVWREGATGSHRRGTHRVVNPLVIDIQTTIEMADDQPYDLVILGGGAGAFAAITEAGERGLSTGMVNAGLPLGGTCVNVGCVPSKHLLAVAHETFDPPRTPFDAVQYSDGEPSFDWNAAIDEKDDLVDAVRESNYHDVADYYGADVYEGYGRFVDDTTIEVVEGEAEGARITGEQALVATGSSPLVPPIAGIDEVDYETSETILDRDDQPDSVVMIGAGYIGLEWGQILNHLGTDVTILEMLERPLPTMEGMIGRKIRDIFEEEGVEIVTDATVTRVGPTDELAANGGVEAGEGDVFAEAEVDGGTRHFEASDLFVAAGVTPNTADMGLADIDVETDDDGAIVIDEHMRTSNPGVYAAGDCTDTIALETVAAKEGNFAVKNAVSDAEHTIDYNAVPQVVFTSPEIASVGTTEREYMAGHGSCSCRTVQLDEVPKALVVEDTRGFLQVVKHHETDQIVGVHMVSPRAGDIIPEATVAVKHGLTVDDIIDTIHPFPTFSEAFKHACQAFRHDAGAMTCCIQ